MQSRLAPSAYAPLTSVPTLSLYRAFQITGVWSRTQDGHLFSLHNDVAVESMTPRSRFRFQVGQGIEVCWGFSSGRNRNAVDLVAYEDVRRISTALRAAVSGKCVLPVPATNDDAAFFQVPGRRRCDGSATPRTSTADATRLCTPMRPRLSLSAKPLMTVASSPCNRRRND